MKRNRCKSSAFSQSRMSLNNSETITYDGSQHLTRSPDVPKSDSLRQARCCKPSSYLAECVLLPLIGGTLSERFGSVAEKLRAAPDEVIYVTRFFRNPEVAILGCCNVQKRRLRRDGCVYGPPGKLRTQ